MIFDILVIISLVAAAIRGFRRGLIVAVFSIVAFIIGLAAAMKLSVVVAERIGKAVKISDQWLPVIAFAIVFFIVVLLVRWIAVMIQKSVEFAMMGWLNKLGGILFYVAINVIIFSIILFYAEQMELIKPGFSKESVTYYYIQPVGPSVIGFVGKLIPFFKGMFTSLENFFGDVSNNILPAN